MLWPWKKKIYRKLNIETPELLCSVKLESAQCPGYWKIQNVPALPLEKTRGLYEKSLLKTYVLKCCSVYRLHFDYDKSLTRPLIGSLTITLRTDLFNFTSCLSCKPRIIMEQEVCLYKSKQICHINNLDVTELHCGFNIPAESTCRQCPVFLCVRGRINKCRVSSVLALRIVKKH